jgi:parallel beta-helix repeat protein
VIEMTTWYFDSLYGLDANNGKSQDKAKRYYEVFANVGFPGAAQGDTYLFKRGTTQAISILNIGVGSGAGTTQRTRYGAYGIAQVPYSIWTPPPTGTLNNSFILNGSGRSYIDFEDMYFDALNRATYTLYLVASGGTGNSGHRFQRCYFANTAPGANGTGLFFGGTDTSTGDTSDYLFEDCHFLNNPVHGMLVNGAHGVVVRRCKFYGNGFNAPAGGHGFSNKYRLQEFTPSGWMQAGLVWYRALAAYQADVYYVTTKVSGYGRLNKNTINPTTPSAGEFGVSGGNLYININSVTNPASQSVKYAWGRCCNLLVEDCEAYDNVNDPSSPFVEGHGFAFDNWTDDSVFRRNKSYNNGGSGFSINMGDRNILESNIAYGNQASGAVLASSWGSVLRHNTFFDNNLGPSGIRNNGEISAFPNCKNGNITNNVLRHIGDRFYGVDIFPDVTGFTGQNNCICGYLNTDRGSALTGTITDNPLLDARHRPQAGAIKRAGAYLGGRDFSGRTFHNPPSIGAVDAAAEPPARYLFVKA